jgi:hypothetical protein
MSELKVYDYEEISSQPGDPDDAEIDALLAPARALKQKEISFNVSGVNSAFVSAVRHSMMSQINVIAFNFKPKSYHNGNDPHQDINFVRQNIRQVPLLQKDELLTAEFELRAENNTAETRDVKSGELIQKKGPKSGAVHYFSPNITIAVLSPGCRVYIDNIYVMKGMGYYKSDHGGLKIAHQICHRPIDIKLWDQFNKDGAHISTSDPRNHHFYFRTEGQKEPKKIIIAACDMLIERLGKLRDIKHNMRVLRDYYILEISNETDAIGNMIIATSYDVFPENAGWKYTMDDINEILKLEMRGDEVGNMLDGVIYECEQQLHNFKKYFQ